MISIDIYKQLMNRLFEQFNQRNYSQRKVELIYQEIKYLTKEDLEKIIDEFIGSKKAPPTVADFRLENAKLRETQAFEIKKQEARKRFLPDDKFQTLVEKITALLRSNLNSEQVIEKLKKADEYLAKINNSICKKCNDSGIFLKKDEGQGTAYKCNCSKGLQRQENWPIIKGV